MLIYSSGSLGFNLTLSSVDWLNKSPKLIFDLFLDTLSLLATVLSYKWLTSGFLLIELDVIDSSDSRPSTLLMESWTCFISISGLSFLFPSLIKFSFSCSLSIFRRDWVKDDFKSDFCRTSNWSFIFGPLLWFDDKLFWDKIEVGILMDLNWVNRFLDGILGFDGAISLIILFRGLFFLSWEIFSRFFNSVC